MVQPDPALGFSVDFDNDGFRNAIKFSMQMGANPDPDRRPKFVKKSTERAYWKNGAKLWPYDGTPVVIDPAPTGPPRTGRDGEPLDPDIEVRVPDDELIEVDCAVEPIMGRSASGELGVGSFLPNRLNITLLDVDYVKIQACKEVIYNGDRYVYLEEPESDGLFDVGVYLVVFKALDES